MRKESNDGKGGREGEVQVRKEKLWWGKGKFTVNRKKIY